jgi:hypothetical protein
MISREKIAVIHIAKSDLEQRGLFEDEEDYRAVLSVAGVKSSTELDEAGFKRVMDRFAELGWESTARVEKKRKQQRQRGSTDNVVGLVTARQLWRIERNYEELGFDSIARRNGFNERQCHKLRPVTIGDGKKIIDGQKALLKRRQRDHNEEATHADER